MSTEEASLGLATTQELIAELSARAEVAASIGEMWPGYSTVGGYATADSIEEQVKPAIEEPTEFGSLVSAWSPTDPDGVAADTWQLSPAHGKHYWQSKSGKVEVWAELTLNPVEVLRVGIGEAPGDAYSRGYEDGVESNLPSPVDRSNIHSAIRDELEAICARDGLAYIEEDSDVITDAVMKALS